jgi:hypothetical protein
LTCVSRWSRQRKLFSGRVSFVENGSKPPIELGRLICGEVKSRLNAALFLPLAQFGGVSTPLTANVPCTPHQAPAGLAAGGSRPADTIDHVHTRATCFTDLRDHAVRLLRRHGRHGLRRCCDGHGKNNCDQSDHWFSLMVGDVSWLSAATFDHNFGQAVPIMDSIAALASSLVPYLPNSLYLTFWVSESSLPGMTEH